MPDDGAGTLSSGQGMLAFYLRLGLEEDLRARLQASVDLAVQTSHSWIRDPARLKGQLMAGDHSHCSSSNKLANVAESIKQQLNWKKRQKSFGPITMTCCRWRLALLLVTTASIWWYGVHIFESRRALHNKGAGKFTQHAALRKI